MEQQITEPIVSMPDDLMSGPLGNILLDEYQQQRVQWWEHIQSEEDKRWAHDDEHHKELKAFSQWAKALSNDDSLLFWLGDRTAEYTAIMCLLTYLPHTLPASVIQVSLAYHKKYKTFRPRSLGEIVPDKAITLIGDEKKLSEVVRRRYVDNWNRLLKNDGLLRVRRSRQVETVTENYFDSEIIRLAQRIYRERKEYFLVAMLIGEFLARRNEGLIDTFVFWRIRNLIQSGAFTYTGSTDSMRECRIKPTKVR